MNDPNAMGGGTPMGQPPVGNPMGATAPSGAEAPMGAGAPPIDDAVLDMHLTEDVKRALQAKGVDISAVADRGPKEPVIVLPISVIIKRYPGGTPEDSMRQFVQDMTQGGQPPEQVSAPPEMATAEAPMPSPEGLGAPMDRPPVVA